MRQHAVISLLILLAPACEKSNAPPAEQPEPAGANEAAATKEPAAADIPWGQKDHQQRMEHMGLVVFPAMKEVFQSHDGDRFADFKCQTCHGDDAKAVNYRMPNAVTPLSVDDPVAAGNDMDEAMTKFMLERVLPVMNETMAGEEITCMSCHLAG